MTTNDTVTYYSVWCSCGHSLANVHFYMQNNIYKIMVTGDYLRDSMINTFECYDNGFTAFLNVIKLEILRNNLLTSMGFKKYEHV